MRLVLLGPPGIGKGTQAKILAEKLSLAHLSSGDILRNEISQDTNLGQLARSFMDKGRLVPDSIILEMMAKRLREEDVNEGYILDGFPRTLPQAEGLEDTLGQLGQQLDAVIALEGDADLLVERLSSRRTCRDCGSIINLLFNPPKKEGSCDNCGGKLYRRHDDKPEVIRERFAVYQRQTEPLIAYYSGRSLLRDIDGMGTIDQVTERITGGLLQDSTGE